MSQPSLFDQPRARLTDPETSAQAAASVRAGSNDLIGYIRGAIEIYGPMIHDHIADIVEQAQPHRWTRGTIVSACARADLVAWGITTNARGRTVCLWAIR